MSRRRHLATAAAVLLAGGLVAASGLDRMSATAPALAPLVPPPWRAAGARAQAVELLAAHPDAALAAAAAAVRRDPVDPAASALLATARLAHGDGEGAAAAFRVAATLGWREPAVQHYWSAAARAAGDWASAGQRLDALLRQDPGLPQAAALLAPFEASAVGRRVLAERLAARPAWRVRYLAPAELLPAGALDRRAQVLAEPALAATLACGEVTAMAQQLLARDRAVAARRLWAGRCGAPASGLIDPGFERARLDAALPFAWTFTGTGDLAIELAPRPGFRGRALRIASTAPQPIVAAVQAVALPPGRYALRWRGADDDPPRLRVALGCERHPARWPAPRRVAPGRYQAEATLAPGGCPLAWLVVAILPGAGAATIDDIAAVPLTTGAASAP